jgi:hypothetical protein
MKNLPRITELIKVEPFKVITRWTTGEIRVIDFEEIFKKWNIKSNSIEAKLLDFQVFKYVSISETKTLQWVNLVYKHPFFDENSTLKEIESPFALDADVLYTESILLENYRLVLDKNTKQAA